MASPCVQWQSGLNPREKIPSIAKVLWDSSLEIAGHTQNCLNGHFGTLLMLEKIVDREKYLAEGSTRTF